MAYRGLFERMTSRFAASLKRLAKIFHFCRRFIRANPCFFVFYSYLFGVFLFF